MNLESFRIRVITKYNIFKKAEKDIKKLKNTGNKSLIRKLDKGIKVIENNSENKCVFRFKIFNNEY
jgi:hypothetical protein